MFERIRKSDRARSSDGGPRNECAARIHDRGWTKVVPSEAMNVLVPGPIVFGVVTMVVRVQVPRRSCNRRARRNVVRNNVCAFFRTFCGVFHFFRNVLAWVVLFLSNRFLLALGADFLCTNHQSYVSQMCVRVSMSWIEFSIWCESINQVLSMSWREVTMHPVNSNHDNKLKQG